MSKDYRIMVAIDLKTGTDRLLEEAQRYGRALNAIVDIIHVAAPDPYFVGYIKGDPGSEQNVDSGRDYHAKDLRLEHEQTQSFATKLRDTGIHVDHVLMVHGPTLTTVLEEARKLSADLLILGSHHHGAIHSLWFGDTAADAAKQAPCALLVVPM